jgi:hypothetical protein
MVLHGRRNLYDDGVTVMYPELIVRAVLVDTELHSLAEVVLIVSLVAVLAAREMVRHRRAFWSERIVPSLTALAIPLAFAWVVIVFERFLELTGG